MRLHFHTGYDRFDAGRDHDVPANLVGALLGDFAEIPDDLCADDVRREHDYGCIRRMARHVGIEDRTDNGRLIKKEKLKDLLLDHFDDGAG